MSEKKSESSYEDKQDHIPSWKTPEIEWFANVYAGKEYNIEFTIPEFTAVCPKTGLPDFGSIFIEYIPRERCVELKSLKEYMMAFRNVGIFHENVVNKILEDFVQAVVPIYVKVIGDYNVRGGVKTIVKREYKA
ncbi:preQ(1) synthase [Leptospira terpstrae]|uniref:NADPH-dependent 7-cyano-7-deazaguanine reductase n=1 Tax=Leptospira terpstrae serovar Hualin str. LT 11-33 = ATCC 700639 TaxID=1257025 RepID=N1VXY8_9LEPT|nr:preQ(1) synthase [Leptospira terpstrae]EMY61637.1 preQ(1) synthase [Leptospira terpstrae serovar Hualin str. LT 11-33 = ATCC 700639]